VPRVWPRHICPILSPSTMCHFASNQNMNSSLCIRANCHYMSDLCNFGMSHGSSAGFSACQAMGPFVNAIMDRASKPPIRLDHLVLTHKHILQKMGSMKKNLKKEKLGVCSFNFHCLLKHSNYYDSDSMLQGLCHGSAYTSRRGVHFLTLLAHKTSLAYIESSGMLKR
jgi:hypothetical protein